MPFGAAGACRLPPTPREKTVSKLRRIFEKIAALVAVVGRAVGV